MNISQDRVSAREKARQKTGEFGHQQHSESVVQLNPSPLTVPYYRGMGGSFHYPNPMDNAEDAIEFWSTVEIPDDAAYAFHMALSSRLNGIYRQRLDEINLDLMQPWDQSNPQPSSEADAQIWQQRREQHFAAIKEQNPDPAFHEVVGFRRPDNALVQQLLRVERMFHAGVDRHQHPEEHRRVTSAIVQMPEGPTHAREVYDRYGLGELQNAGSMYAIMERQSKMMEGAAHRGGIKANDPVRQAVNQVADSTYRTADHLNDIKYGVTPGLN